MNQSDDRDISLSSSSSLSERYALRAARMNTRRGTWRAAGPRR